MPEDKKSIDPSSFENEKKRVRPSETVGGPSFRIHGGWLEEKEVNAKLVRSKKYKTYTDMLTNISIIGSGVRYYLNLLCKPEWSAKPADDSEEAKRYAEIVEESMKQSDRSWHRIVRRAGGYRFYGFSIQEWIAERHEEGYFYFRDVAPRPQSTIERWDTNESGVVLGAEQWSPQDYSKKYLPRSKIIYIVDDSLDDSPEGLGLFRHLADPAARLQRYQQLEMSGFETDLRGVPIFRVPMAAMNAQIRNNKMTKADKSNFLRSIEEFAENHIRGTNTHLKLDSKTYDNDNEKQGASSTYMWDVELLSTSSTTMPELNLAITRLIEDIARLLGVESLLLGATSHGSQALSTDKTHQFGLIVESSLKEIREAFQRDYVKRLFILNGWDLKLMPTLTTEEVQHKDIVEITTALKDIATAGGVMQPNDPAINEVRALLGLSDAPEFDMFLDSMLNGRITDGDPSSVNDSNRNDNESEGE
jgi:hypothetical protein